LNTDEKPVDNKPLFHKLVRLHRWDEQRRETLAAEKAAPAPTPPDALRAVESLAADRAGFARFMCEAERLLGSPGEDKPAGAKEPGGEGAEEKGAAPEPPAELKRLCALLEGSPRLREIFAGEPPFSSADPRAVETLARFADVTPDGQSMLNTQDAVFMGVLEAVQGPALAYASPMPGDEISWAAALLFAEHLGKTLAVQAADEAAAERLAALTPEHWHVVLSSLEDSRDYTDGPRSEAGKLLGELRQQTPQELQAGFGRPPRISQIEPRLFRLVWEKRRELGKMLLPRDAPLGTAQAAYFRPAGIEARDLLINEVEGCAEPVRDFSAALRLRFELARHLVGVRKDAKVETLIYKWPQAARLALANRSSIINVESYLLRQNVTEAPPGATEEERELYKLTQEDELFARLLRTRPYFSEIALFQYLSASPLPPVTRPAPTPAAPPAPPAPPTGSATTTTQTTTPDDEPRRQPPTHRRPRGAMPDSPAPTQTPTDEYDTYVFNVEPVGPADASDPNVWEWHAAIYHDGGIIGPPASVKIDLIKLRREVFKSVLGEFESAPGDLAEPADPQPLLSRMFSRTDREYLFKVVQAGKTLFKSFFRTFADVLRSTRHASGLNANVRMAVACDPELTPLPWEWLALPGGDANFVLSERHSLVRFLPSPVHGGETPPEPEFAQRLTPPLRVLIVMPSYERSMQEETESRATLLDEELKQRGVMTRRLSGELITLESVRRAINDFIPHVLHFEGRIDVVSTPMGLHPYLSLTEPLTLAQLKVELRLAGLQLLVLRNSSSFIYTAAAVHGLLEGLVGEVIPAALAPVRAMDEGPGFEFVRSFYRALCDGRRLEEAVARARMELLSKGGDWSAYALFAHLPTLQASRLLPPPGLE
jgi:hypothetical protein